MTVRKTVLYCPDDAEALIAETLGVILDSRVIETSIEAAPADPPVRREEESDVSYATRCWADYLPTTATNQTLQFRSQWGWTEEESRFVIHALERVRTQLVLASRTAVLEGTRETLQRDSKRIIDIQWRWPTEESP